MLTFAAAALCFLRKVLSAIISHFKSADTSSMSKILLIFLLITTSFSCSKQIEETRNITIHLSGQVLDSATHEGIGNVPVTAISYIKNSGMCASCLDSAAVTTTTNAYGYFNLSVTTDSMFFYSNGLNIEANPGFTYSSINPSQTIKTTAHDISDIQLIFFSGAGLIISRVHTSTDSITALNIDYTYTSTWQSINCPYLPFPIDSIYVLTLANEYTKIWWRTTYASGDTKEFLDSIKCLPNHDNGYTVRY